MLGLLLGTMPGLGASESGSLGWAVLPFIRVKRDSYITCLLARESPSHAGGGG